MITSYKKRTNLHFKDLIIEILCYNSVPCSPGIHYSKNKINGIIILHKKIGVKKFSNYHVKYGPIDFLRFIPIPNC